MAAAGHLETDHYSRRLTPSCESEILTSTVPSACFRILEQFILRGESANVLEEVISELGNNHRQNPQELDRAVAGYLRQVQRCLNVDHQVAVTQNFRKD